VAVFLQDKKSYSWIMMHDMSVRIKYFKREMQANESRQSLANHSIKSFLRERQGPHPHDPPAGFELFVLRDEDLDEARQLLDYEFGTDWGENTI
jgi:hypothetical protein